MDMNNNKVKSDTGKPGTDERDFETEENVFLDVLLQNGLKMVYSVRQRHLYRSQEEFEELVTVNYNEKR